MVSPAEDLSILIEIDQVYQQLLTCGTRKASWVPAGARTRSGGKNCHFSSIDSSSALMVYGKQKTKKQNESHATCL